MEKKALSAAATLVGATIGAGVLGIPYVVSQSGFTLGIANIVFIGMAIIVLNLYLGEIVLRTKGKHQLTGYARLYLGETGKKVMTIVMIIGIYGSMLAYTIGVGESLASIFGISAFKLSLIFYIIGALLVYIGLKAIEKSETLLTSVILVIVVLITLTAFLSNNFDYANLEGLNLAKIVIPYGVVLFAFLGVYAIPEMSQELGKRKRLLKNAIIIGGIIPIIIYSLFAMAVIGVSGTQTSQIATIGFGEALGQKILVASNLFAVFAMTTSFLALGLAMKQMFNFDYKLKRNIAWVFTVIVPITAFFIMNLMNITNFIIIIGLVGAIAGGLEGIMIVFMHKKARVLGERTPEYSLPNSAIAFVLLILMFTLGILYQIF